MIHRDTCPSTGVCAALASGTNSVEFEYDPQRVWKKDQLPVLDILVHPVWIFDLVERRMRWSNTAGLALWNAETREELLSRTYQDMSPSTVKRLQALHIECEHGRNIPDEWTVYPKGKAKAVHVNASGLRLSEDEDHISIMFEGIPYIRDELEQDKTRGVEMLRHLPLAVCQFDMQGQIMYQNPEAMLATAPVEHTVPSELDVRRSETRSVYINNDNDDTYSSSSENTSSSSSTSKNSVGPPRWRKENDGLLNRFVDRTVGNNVLKEIQSNEVYDLEAVLNTRSGPKSCLIQLRKSKDPVTSEDVILFSAKDNSDAHRARKERLAREQKSEFFAIMAHEIRTPLHQVMGFIDLLNQTPLNKEQQSFVNILETAAKGLMTVISDVLDFSKLEAGKMKVESIPYEPLSVVNGAIEAVRQSCDERNLYLRLEWDKSIPFRIRGDPNRVRQVMLNLLSNAIKFTDEGGICVQAFSVKCLEKAQPMLKFIVKDTGRGVAKDHQTVIFRKYQQADPSVARQFGGTGLGLSICQLLVDRMGGFLGVDSELGAGSSFWFTIPAELPVDVGRVGLTKDESVKDFAKLHILVAEDNKVNQKLVARMLDRMGHTCDIAENGKIALDMIIKGHYDCCLMDIQMPTMDGLEATGRLRSMGFKDLPILGLTASVARPDFKELGFNDWITKPVPFNVLKSKLVTINRSEQQRQPGE